jgi:hypothetical protein
MKKIRVCLRVGALILIAAALGPGTKIAAAQGAAQAQASPTLAAAVDREISAVEKEIVDAAEAMPEDKFNFTPESLNIPGSDTKACAHLRCR